jgi:hypothetical protein
MFSHRPKKKKNLLLNIFFFDIYGFRRPFAPRLWGLLDQVRRSTIKGHLRLRFATVSATALAYAHFVPHFGALDLEPGQEQGSIFVELVDGPSDVVDARVEVSSLVSGAGRVGGGGGSSLRTPPLPTTPRSLSRPSLSASSPTFRVVLRAATVDGGGLMAAHIVRGSVTVALPAVPMAAAGAGDGAAGAEVGTTRLVVRRARGPMVTLPPSTPPPESRWIRGRGATAPGVAESRAKLKVTPSTPGVVGRPRSPRLGFLLERTRLASRAQRLYAIGLRGLDDALEADWGLAAMAADLKEGAGLNDDEINR